MLQHIRFKSLHAMYIAQDTGSLRSGSAFSFPCSASFYMPRFSTFPGKKRLSRNGSICSKYPCPNSYCETVGKISVIVMVIK